MTSTPSRAHASKAAWVEIRDGSGSQRFVPACGGTIAARNLPKGGAVFDVLLPLVDLPD